MRIVDPVTGDSSTVCLFVGVLPSGRYAFAEPALGMTRNTWLRAHVAMYGWFGGSTPRLVRDSLRTGVIRHPREGEIVLNDAYRGMAGHYSAAVLPGRVKRPKDKPSAENTVWHATMALVGAMRDREFGSPDELRTAIREWLAEYNARPFRKRDGSRLSVFESEERPLLIALPPMPYEVADRAYGRRVQANGVFSQVGVSVFVRYFFRFWAWVCRPGVFYWFWGLPNMSAWLMRWLCPVNSMSRPWWTMRSMIEAASLSSAKIVPHLLNSMFVVKMMLLLS